MAKKVQKDLEYKVDMIFNYTQNMHKELFTILSMVGIIFALLVFNTYVIYDTLITDNIVAESDFGLFPPFSISILFLILAISVLALASFKKGKFERLIKGI